MAPTHVGRIAGLVATLPVIAIGCASARVESGNSSSRNIPEMQNATTATTMARRSVESAGAPDAVVTNG